MSLWTNFLKDVKKAADRNGISAFVVAGFENAEEKTHVSPVTIESGHAALMKLSSCCVAFEQFVESLKVEAPEPEKKP